MMGMMSLVPGGLKSPVVIMIALTLLAVSLWGAWIFLRNSNGAHRVHNNPAAISQETETTNVRAAWVI